MLVLHLNRSVHSGHYASKNTCRVLFPEILDLTPYTTSGQLSTSPSVPISTPPPAIPRSTTPTPAVYATPRVLYRLSAVVCHYGQHSFGHYICFRRKPRPLSAGPHRYDPPKLACPLGCDCEQCERIGPVRDDGAEPPRPRRGWLRCSDDTVWECSFDAVLQEGAGAFMLFYERVVMPRQNIYMSSSPRSSEETVRPEGAHANGSYTSLANGDATQDVQIVKPVPTKVVGPRVIHRVSAQPSSRSSSMSPPDRDPVPRPGTQSLASSTTSLPNGHAVSSSKDNVPWGSHANGDVPLQAENVQAASVRLLSPHKQTSPPTTSSRPAAQHRAQAASPSISFQTEPRPSPPIVGLRA